MAVNPLFDVDGVIPLMCPWSEKKEQSFITSRRGTGFGGEGVKFLIWLNFGTSILGSKFSDPFLASLCKSCSTILHFKAHYCHGEGAICL